MSKSLNNDYNCGLTYKEPGEKSTLEMSNYELIELIGRLDNLAKARELQLEDLAPNQRYIRLAGHSNGGN